MDTAPDTIGRLRASVDELDTLLVDLLNRRATLALAVAREKTRLGVAIRVPGRERAVMRHVSAANPGPLDAAAVSRVYKAILAESRRLQREGAHRG